MIEITVPVATYVADDMAALAETLGVSVDAVACYFFGREVVHT